MSKINYILIAIAVVILVIGYVLMSGSPSGLEYNPDIFSTRRITVAPIVCFVGFVLMVVGIMIRGKKKD